MMFLSRTTVASALALFAACACHAASPVSVQINNPGGTSINSAEFAIKGNVQQLDSEHGPAFLFDGKDGAVELKPYGRPATFTAEAWFKMDAAKERNMILYRRGKGNQWQIWLEKDNRLYAFVWGEDSRELVWQKRTEKALLPNRWYHVAMSIDSTGRGTLFLNGEPAIEAPPSNAMNSGNSPVLIGGSEQATFRGMIAGVRIYNSFGNDERMAEIRETLKPFWKNKVTTEEAMGFESRAAWLTAPADILDVMPEEKLWSTQSRGTKDWQIIGQSFAELAGGAQLSTTNVKQGQYSLLWRDHEKYPTLICKAVTGDWSGSNAVEISIFSERATGETVTFAALSDKPETPWRDYLTHPIVIDWQGWKTIRLPFSEFTALNEPAGWNKIDGLYFFAKAFRHQPNPYTVLYLDDMNLISGAMAAAKQEQSKQETFVYKLSIEDELTPLNHAYPEIAPSKANTPITHQPYFRAERAMYKYYPRFNPGYVSFDPKGKAYINIADTIETLNDKREWISISLRKPVEDWARAQGWAGVMNRWGAQGTNPAIRFDRDGGIYTLAQLMCLDANGKEVDAKLRCTLLLYSHDGMKTWQTIKLPGRVAEFERIDGHNQDALIRPPVIMIGDYGYFEWGDPAGYFVLPKKNADKSLAISDAIQFADACIPPNFHSGDGNVVLTHGDILYIAYGWYLPKHLAENVEWKAKRPTIPDNHPALALQYTYTWGSEKRIGEAKNGIPTFMRTYNLKTREFSKPVFVGMGGGFADDHNWPAITADSKGLLHVLINGHHNPSMYTHSVKPWDISEWSAPEYLLVNTKEPNISYNTFNCDNNDNLYFVSRSTKGVYNNHLGLYRKKSGGEWEEERTLVTPFRYMYNVWYHRMNYDPINNRLFLTYFSQGGMVWLSREQYEFYVFTWPDKEKTMCANIGQPKGALDPGPIVPGGMYRPGGSEIAILVSDDGGDTWHLATTEDFLPRSAVRK